MTRSIQVEPHLSLDELARRYRGTKDPVEHSHWHFLWLLARGLTAKVIDGITGCSAYWIGRIARRYNECGPDGVKDQRQSGTARQTPVDRATAGCVAGSAWRASSAARSVDRADRLGMDQPAPWAARQSPTRLGLPAVPRRTSLCAAPASCAGRSAGASGLQAASAPAATRCRDGLPTHDHRVVGGRRTQDRAQAQSAQGVGTARYCPVSAPLPQSSSGTTGATLSASSIPLQGAQYGI